MTLNDLLFLFQQGNSDHWLGPSQSSILSDSPYGKKVLEKLT